MLSMSCAVCGTEAPSEKNLKQHIHSKHDDCVLKCEVCDVTCKGGMKLKIRVNCFVGESRVWWRADFQSGVRVLKKMF